MFSLLVFPLLLQSVAARLASRPRASGPTVSLDYATYQGYSSSGLDIFLGMRFASPPIPRLHLPKKPAHETGVVDATKFGNDCPQQQNKNLAIFNNLPTATLNVIGSIPGGVPAAGNGEDCLFINLARPSNATDDDARPVLVWIYGGGFETGGSSSYDGTPIVQRSISSGQPIIFVSFNYRLSAFGFLPGQDIKDAGLGNLGLHDQRFAFKWVNKYISQFGGDPDKVTIWGESAGALSVSFQMLGQGGHPHGLFRGVFANSGSPTYAGDIADVNAQPVYDTVVEVAGCADEEDKLQCLREVDYDTYKNASDSNPDIFAYNSLKEAYIPRADGVFFHDYPQRMVLARQYARVPIVSGECDDEGTLFSLQLSNITTEKQFRTYVHENYYPNATQHEITRLAKAYPQDPAQGSPYGTGDANEIYPQYKRLASIQGDLAFESARRLFLRHTKDTQPTWSFINKRLKATPVLGSFHSTDLIQFFSKAGDDITREAQDYLINFVNNLDPNVGANPSGKLIYWPQYGENHTMIQFSDPSPTGEGGVNGLSLTEDFYRKQGIKELIRLGLRYPF